MLWGDTERATKKTTRRSFFWVHASHLAYSRKYVDRREGPDIARWSNWQVHFKSSAQEQLKRLAKLQAAYLLSFTIALIIRPATAQCKQRLEVQEHTLK